MRRLLSVLSLSLIVPLAACFDVEMTMSLKDENSAEMTMVMVASPEFYAMSSEGGDDLCTEEGNGQLMEDGSYVCTETMSGTIDEILEDPDMGEGVTVERRDGGLIYVAFDLTDLTEDMAPSEEEGMDGMEGMEEMMREAFAGHGITINVAGAEIVETNGSISEDGKTATYKIPLTYMFDSGTESDLPDTFSALVKPGS
jgi:hypothetical protein